MQTSLLTAFEKFFARRSAIIPMMLLMDAVFATHCAAIANWFLVSANGKILCHGLASMQFWIRRIHQSVIAVF
jgi:hypothetical protein